MSVRISALWIGRLSAMTQLLTWQSLVPKRIEVKPVIRRKARVMLQALGVALHPKLNVFGAMIAIQSDLIGKMFEVNFVAVSAAVQTKKQNHRATHCRGQQHRDRKSTRLNSSHRCISYAV